MPRGPRIDYPGLLHHRVTTSTSEVEVVLIQAYNLWQVAWKKEEVNFWAGSLAFWRTHS